MASELDGIADALVADLLAQPGAPWPAVKGYVLELELAGDVDTLKCTVVPAGLPTLGQVTREKRRLVYQVAIVLQKRVPGDATAVAAAMPALLESVQNLVTALPYGAGLTVGSRVARLVNIENVPAYDAEHLETWGQFTSVVTTDWEIVR